MSNETRSRLAVQAANTWRHQLAFSDAVTHEAITHHSKSLASLSDLVDRHWQNKQTYRTLDQVGQPLNQLSLK